VNVEQEEARAVMDKLAAEIHGVYIQHAERIGIKAPAWDVIPDSERGLCRDIARVIMSKVGQAYTEGQSAGKSTLPKIDVPITMPKTWTAEDAKSVVKEIAVHLAGVIDKIADLKSIENRQPVVEGIDAAIVNICEKMVFEAFEEKPELKTKLKERVVDSLMNVFFGEDEEEDPENIPGS